MLNSLTRFYAASVLVVLALLLMGCGDSETGGLIAPADRLGVIQQRGALVVSIDPNYPPQSEFVPNGQRAAYTRCADEQWTATQVRGFDVDAAVEIADRLGVDVCFVGADWERIVTGDARGEWDVSIASVTITPERMENLYFTQPYYATPVAFFVHRASTTFAGPGDLEGARVGVCADCTYELYLERALNIPGIAVNYIVGDVSIATYDTDRTALEDLARGNREILDAVLTAVPTGEEAIADGLAVKQLGDPVFFEYLAGAVPRMQSAGDTADMDPQSLVLRISEIIRAMHNDGTLSRFSTDVYHIDLSLAAGNFQFDAETQFP